MTLPAAVNSQALAEMFAHRAARALDLIGKPPPADGWPHLEADVPVVEPLVILALPALTTAAVDHHLRQRGLPRPPLVIGAGLRGMLMAWRGAGLIFIDADLDRRLRRQTLAHELAHWLADYHWVRETAKLQFGPGIIEALDGQRPLRPGERLASALVGRTATPMTHYLGHPDDPPSRSRAIQVVEARAELLGQALLAPDDRALAVGAAAGLTAHFHQSPQWVALISDHFDITTDWATAIVERLFGPRCTATAFTTALGLSRPVSRPTL